VQELVICTHTEYRKQWAKDRILLDIMHSIIIHLNPDKSESDNTCESIDSNHTYTRGEDRDLELAWPT
jgi:hypothetical protein